MMHKDLIYENFKMLTVQIGVYEKEMEFYYINHFNNAYINAEKEKKYTIEKLKEFAGKYPEEHVFFKLKYGG